jgi:hypothetical protein
MPDQLTPQSFYLRFVGESRYSLFNSQTDLVILAGVTAGVAADFLKLNEPEHPALDTLTPYDSYRVDYYNDSISAFEITQDYDLFYRAYDWGSLPQPSLKEYHNLDEWTFMFPQSIAGSHDPSQVIPTQLNLPFNEDSSGTVDDSDILLQSDDIPEIDID